MVADPSPDPLGLDEVVAELDAQTTSEGRRRAAAALYERGLAVQDLHGDEAALPVYEGIVGRLEGSSAPEARVVYLDALNSVAVIRDRQGRHDEALAAATTLVDRHLDDAPLEAGLSVANAALLYTRLRYGPDERDAAIAVLERSLARYGDPEVPEHRYIAALADKEIAWHLGNAGRLNECVRRYDKVVDALDGTTDPDLRGLLAGSLASQAFFYGRRGDTGRHDELCRLLVERFNPGEGPEIADHVDWARQQIDHDKQPRRRGLFRGRR